MHDANTRYVPAPTEVIMNDAASTVIVIHGSAAVDALRLLITFIITQPSQNERLDEIGNTQVTDLSLRITHPL